MITTFQQHMPRCSLIRQMKGLHESFHLQYQRPSADNQSKIRYQSVTQAVPFFQKKVVTSDFFFFPEYWQQALDAASKSRQSGLSFAASMTCYRSSRDPQIFLKTYSAWVMPAFLDFFVGNSVTRCSMLLLLAGLSADGR